MYYCATCATSATYPLHYSNAQALVLPIAMATPMNFITLHDRNALILVPLVARVIVAIIALALFVALVIAAQMVLRYAFCYARVALFYSSYYLLW